MQSTFEKMYNLVKTYTFNPLEDYLTEVIAPIFSKEEILTSFLNKFSNGHFESAWNIRVNTQKTFYKILDHDTDSRPDLVITFENEKGRHIIFFENKLGTGEGTLQLKRYYDHLHSHNVKGYYTYLFYITRKYDPKKKSGYFQKGTKFNQLQWFQFYNWLMTFKGDLYVNEVLKYMEVNELNKSRKFTPTDIYALQNLYKLQSMLDETLNGKVKEIFIQLFGKPMQWSNRANQLRTFNRYVSISDQSDWKFIGCGFRFTEEEYPDITVFLEIGPNCRRKDELIKAINTFCIENEEWIFESPEDEKDYFRVYLGKSLLSFLAESDHIESIQKYIIEKLHEIHRLKVQFPELKWEERV
ncbi:hypothetical protein A2U94_16715 [Bacillus sp. VT 712]|jgi:PD-(D/E)XK nuclease superfamily|nr:MULTISPECIES: PD-(D/E)XK nuclease family protein [Bacillaceae]KZB90343.1 hypothetical protein A2U94_16715 [Bacillus sp. VT 712]